MKALYRRYRPTTLEEVVAEKQVTDPLLASIQKGQIGHAYLFVGPRGCGKTSVARILAHQINGFKYELEDDYLDIIEIDAASNTGVDNIRELRERAVVAPVEGKYKVYIIDEVHMLSKSAFNALLKTLEEPPEHVVFIMATTNFEKVPATIVSRCQTFQFKLADPSEMLEHLKKITKAEKISIEDEALNIIVNRGGGSFRDTLSLLDQISTISTKKITAQSVREILGMPSEESVKVLLDAYKNQDLDTIRKQIIELKKDNVDINQIAERMISHIIDNLDLQLLQIVEPLTEVSKSNYPDVKLLSILATPSIKAPAITNVKAPATASIKAPAATSVKAPAAANTAPAQHTSNTTETKPVTKPASQATPEPSTKPAIPPVEEEVAIKIDQKTETPKTGTANIEYSDEKDLWQKILNGVHEKSAATYAQIKDVGCKINGNTLTIYAGGDWKMHMIKNRLNIITEFCPSNLEISLSDKSLQNDETLADIAELMGGGEEVALSE